MPNVEVRIAESDAEREAVYRFRYDVYVAELGRYRATADHGHRRLADPEDERSCVVYAREGDEVVGSFRLTWGGDGFSARQLAQYQLDPFLAEVPAERLAVGERTMIAPRWRGSDLFERMGGASASFVEDHDVQIVFGACEPHLISFYLRHQRPYGARNINSPDAGYLIPLVSFPSGVEVLTGSDGVLPSAVREVLADTGTVTSPEFVGKQRYLSSVRVALRRSDALAVRDLDDHEVDALLHHSNVICFHAGDVLVKEGGSARNMFIVLDGRLHVSHTDRCIATVLPGDVVGEIAYLLECPRGADVVAATDGRVLSLSERTVRTLFDREPAAAAKLHRNIARQVSARLQAVDTA